MKLTKNNSQAGLTLIEITLVIAVLLGLISVLFIGVSAYKEGSNRAKCILNISNVQKAVRSYQNLYELEVADALANATIMGTGKMLETVPGCPTTTGTYTFLAVVPAIGTPYLTCSLAGSAASQHNPSSVSGW